MESIVNVKDCFDHSELLEILAECVFNPTPERLKIRAENYMRNPQTRIFAIEQDGVYISIIVLDISNSKQIEILGLAIRKDLQKNGVGRKMIGFCAGAFMPDTILAETDDDAVGFYRKVGFSVQPLGDKYGAGINRYLCTLMIPQFQAK
jgi:ribosomal protein S18 acetylase RimI-like enzyme